MLILTVPPSLTFTSSVDSRFVPRTRLGDRSFIVAGARPCNSLPANLRRSDAELVQFKRVLNTHLFTIAETAAH